MAKQIKIAVKSSKTTANYSIFKDQNAAGGMIVYLPREVSKQLGNPDEIMITVEQG